MEGSAMQLTFTLEAENNALRARISELEKQLAATQSLHRWRPAYKNMHPEGAKVLRCTRCNRIEQRDDVLGIPDNCTGGK